MKQRYYRPSKLRSPERNSGAYQCLIVGAGAVENAWKPVIEAIQPFYEFELDGDTVNLILARLVYLLKWYSSLDTEFAKTELQKHIDFANELKQLICSKLLLAQKQKEIKVRENFGLIVEKFLFTKNNQSFVVSTNWDTVIDDALNKIGQSDLMESGNIKTFHIHGSIRGKGNLYLPTEVTREQYRTLEEDNEIGIIHGDIMRNLELCNVSIIYGLSLSPLDIELCQTLASGWDSPNLKKIIIIDINHKLISQRVKSLLRRPKAIKILAYHPNDLNNSIDYTER